MNSIRILIKGKVHGVFYRANVLQIAKSLLLKGTVKNCVDGSVEIITQGKDESIFELIRWCKKGPPLSKVSEVICQEITYQIFDDFKIVY